MRKTVFFALAASLALAAPAHAVLQLSQTLTFSSSFNAETGALNINMPFTGGSQTLALNQFDTRGGRFTLQSVAITWAPTVDAALTFISGSGNTRNSNSTFTVASQLTSATAGTPFPLPAEFTRTQNVVLAGQGATASILLASTDSNSFTAASVAPYIGSGTVSFTNSLLRVANSSGLTGNSTARAEGNIGGTLEFTYFFVDDIPEPGTWAMLIAGFGLTGASMRRCRAQHSLKAVAA